MCYLSPQYKLISSYIKTRSATAKDDHIYSYATGSLNLRGVFVLIPFEFVLVALVSCRRDLRSSAVSFHITCL